VHSRLIHFADLNVRFACVLPDDVIKVDGYDGVWVVVAASDNVIVKHVLTER